MERRKVEKKFENFWEKCLCPGSNRGSSACKADVITTTPQRPALGNVEHSFDQRTHFGPLYTKPQLNFFFLKGKHLKNQKMMEKNGDF